MNTMSLSVKKYNDLKQSFSQINEGKGKTYLLLIGIDLYRRGNKLNFCEQEAGQLFNIFSKHKDLKRNNIYSLLNEDATKENILNHFHHLNNTLSIEDNLVVFLAGKGIANEYSNFFVPFNGRKENLHSCITNDFFFDFVVNLPSKNSCVFLDIKYNQSEIKFVKAAGNFEKSPVRFDDGKLEEDLFSDCCRLFMEDYSNRVRETYCFTKVVGSERTGSSKSSFKFKWNKGLADLIEKTKTDLDNLLEKKKIDKALEQAHLILENNDDDLLGRVNTLQTKAKEFSRAYAKGDIDRNQLDEEVTAIEVASRNIVEKISRRKFYLVPVSETYAKETAKDNSKTKILFASANPVDTAPLRLDREVRDIEYELLKSKNRDKFELIKFQAMRIVDLQFALLNHGPQFIHFSGHGNCDGICLLDDKDEATVVKAKPLANLFKLFSTELKCVFLNSCHSVSQSREISKYIQKVVCMGRSVPDEIAIHFATAFYKSIGAGKDIDFSFEFAKNSIDLHNSKGSKIPQLLSKPALPD